MWMQNQHSIDEKGKKKMHKGSLYWFTPTLDYIQSSPFWMRFSTNTTTHFPDQSTTGFPQPINNQLDFHTS